VVIVRRTILYTKISAVVLLLLSISILGPVQSGKSVSEELEKVKCFVSDGKRIRLVERYLAKDKIEKIEKALREVIRGGFTGNKIKELQYLLKRYKLLPEDFDLISLREKYLNLNFGELKKEIKKEVRRYPMVYSFVEKRFSEIESLGVNDATKVKDIPEILGGSKALQAGPVIFNICCIVGVAGCGVTLPSLVIAFSPLLFGVAAPSPSDVHPAPAIVNTFGLLGDQVIISYLLPIGFLIIGFVGFAIGTGVVGVVGFSLVTVAAK